MAYTQPIRNKRHIKLLSEYFLARRKYRNHALFVFGLHTALRISDILRLTWPDVYDFERGVYRTHITLAEQKTGKTKTIALHPQIIRSLERLFEHRSDGYLFESNRRTKKAISRVQAWRIIHTAALAVGIVEWVGCHSLRKSFGYHAWTDGASPVVLMDIYNHSSYLVTRRYLGVTQDDTDKIYLGMKLL